MSGGELGQHEASVVAGQGFACQWEGCMWACASPEELFEHLGMHAEREPWPIACPYCEYRTSFQWRLSSHIRRHQSQLQALPMLQGGPVQQAPSQAASQAQAQQSGDETDHAQQSSQPLPLHHANGHKRPREGEAQDAAEQQGCGASGGCGGEREPEMKARRTTGCSHAPFMSIGGCSGCAHLAEVIVLDSVGDPCGDSRQVLVTESDSVGDIVLTIEQEILPEGQRVERVWRCLPDGRRILIDRRQYRYSFHLMFSGCAVAVDVSAAAAAAAAAAPRQQQQQQQRAVPEEESVLQPQVDQCTCPECPLQPLQQQQQQHRCPECAQQQPEEQHTCPECPQRQQAKQQQQPVIDMLGIPQEP
eukprot:m51a1_g8294 hypothetical protein (361) ;mRNA; f:167823-169481